MATCSYCRMIHATEPDHKVRKANWDLGGDFPRCSWHWQFICDRCGASVSFHGVAWCERIEEFLCINCAPRHQKRVSRFWAWDYYYELWCQQCSRYHAALDWLEFKGRHPWQKDGSARRALRGLSRKKALTPFAWVRWASAGLQHPSLQEIQRRWDSAADKWDTFYGKYGDSYRRNIFNPALFPLLGEVKGKKILDAGCGAGYLSRLLAERGATVVGVDLSKRFIEIAKRYEKGKPLGISYERANIANLSRFPDGSFDMVVSVYVLDDARDCRKAIKEIARVLGPSGTFIFLIEHPCFGWHTGGWERVPMDSKRSEDCLYFKADNYFKRGSLEGQWDELPVLLSFRRPLSDYFRFLRESGLLVRDLVEPRPLPKALRERPAEWQRENRVPPVLIIDAIKASV